MALYQDGILVSGANTLPKLTQAQYDALPAELKPEYWVCLDKDYDDILAEKSDIGNIESGTTASRAYSVGELVYVSGTLYRVKTAIASGATFTVGTNVEVTNVSNIIKEVNKGSVSVSSDGTKTFATLLNELYALIDMSKMSIHSKLAVGGYLFTRYTTTLTFTGTSTSSSTLDTRTITIGSNDSVYYEGVISASGFTSYDISTIVAPIGTTITLYY